VIASQAVITGAYSVASQAAQLGYLPRLRIAHTSESRIGQIYVPWVNWLLMVSVLTLVFAFRSSTALAFAFGMAVTGTITITTLLYFYVARLKWYTPLWLLGTGGFVLLGVDLLFVAANLTKLVHGAWLPLLIALTAFTIMTTWQRGRDIVTAERERREGPLPEFVEALRTNKALTGRVPGTAVFLNRGKQTAPLALRANVEHNRGNWSPDESTLLRGGYDPLRPYLERMEVDQLVLEYATERAGGLIAFEGKELGLGVVNPRTSEVESVDEVRRSVERALALYPAERLFLNPDCGFGTFSNRPVNQTETALAKLASAVSAARSMRGG